MTLHEELPAGSSSSWTVAQYATKWKKHIQAVYHLWATASPLKHGNQETVIFKFFPPGFITRVKESKTYKDMRETPLTVESSVLFTISLWTVFFSG